MKSAECPEVPVLCWSCGLVRNSVNHSISPTLWLKTRVWRCKGSCAVSSLQDKVCIWACVFNSDALVCPTFSVQLWILYKVKSGMRCNLFWLRLKTTSVCKLCVPEMMAHILLGLIALWKLSWFLTLTAISVLSHWTLKINILIYFWYLLHQNFYVKKIFKWEIWDWLTSPPVQ